jgi:hypothetical protein
MRAVVSHLAKARSVDRPSLQTQKKFRPVKSVVNNPTAKVVVGEELQEIDL